MDPGRSLLPHILDLLSRQPTLSADVEDLCKALEPLLMAEHIAPFGTLKKAVDFAIKVGTNLGILSLTEETMRLPFNSRRKNAVDKRPLTPCKPRPVRKTGKKKLTKSRAKATKAKAKPRGRGQCRKSKPRVTRRR